MAKLTKFKAQQVEFGTHYKIEETNRGDTKIKSITPAFGNVREPGTPETEEIYNGLQLGNVHTLQANKTTNLNIDYYVCNLDGLTEFGVNNDLKLRINVDTENTNETYELTYNGSQFVVINIDSRLNEIMGLEFAGNIQDAGDKVKGKCYFDNVTKFYYECIADTNLTYNDVTKFRAISNKPISDRVGNLYKTKILKNSQIDSRIMSYFKDCYLIKQGNIAVFSGYLDPQFDRSINTVGKVLFRLPFAPISESWARPAFTLKTSGDVEAGYLNVFASNKITEPIHVNFSYICESEN